jgi:hypothetical protein
MTTTHDDNATTWRDLADQLTPKQQATLERYERDFANHNIPPTAELLAIARDSAQHNLSDQMFADLPMPGGVQLAEHWQPDGDEWARAFDGTSRTVKDTDVWIVGEQRASGAINRVIHVYLGGTDDLHSDDARQLAAALVEAADEIDRLR